MCGIVGYIGDQDALQTIVAGLERLEYRGYDSAGVAVVEQGQVVVTKAQGKLSELKKALEKKPAGTKSGIGIGHTRWATHGKPSDANAHPHSAGRVSLIHNGIIENYIELREDLKRSGSSFKSETDTEIAAHLLNRHLNAGLEPFEALKKFCSEIRGSYAFVAIDAENPDRLLVAKNSTPIIVGLGKKEVFVASDIPAILPHTRDVVILEDGDLAEVRLGSLRIENSGKPVQRKPQHISWDPVTAQKGGYKHYMLKEIHEQVQILEDAFRGRVDFAQGELSFDGFSLSAADFKNIERIVLIGCGSAWHACLTAKFYLESLVHIPCEVDYSSEFRYRTPVFDQKTLVIAVSQSGETLDTLAALELVKGKSRTLALCNVLGSSITRKVQDVIYNQAGPEISVASTKAFTSQLLIAYLLAIHLGRLRGVLTQNQSVQLLEPLLKLPSYVDKTLHCEKQIQEIARKFHKAADFLFLGRGLCYPVALEGALKLKEISYIHAEGYPAGEMKHGPIALISETMPVVAVLQNSAVFEKSLSNVREVNARDGRIIALTDVAANSELADIADHVIEIPYLSEYLSPLLLTIPLQLLAYHVAVLNGTDVDLPRNLAKSVTVE